MRLLAWLVGLPVAALAVLFAVSNRQPIAVGLWPFSEAIEAPAFVIALVPFALGLIGGAALAGVGTLRARLRHRAERRKVRTMERRLDEMRMAEAAKPKPSPAPAIAAPGAAPRETHTQR